MFNKTLQVICSYIIIFFIIIFWNVKPLQFFKQFLHSCYIKRVIRSTKYIFKLIVMFYCPIYLITGILTNSQIVILGFSPMSYRKRFKNCIRYKYSPLIHISS